MLDIKAPIPMHPPASPVARERLLIEARSILLAGENDAFCVDRIASRARCSRRSFYNAFRDIDELHRHIAERWLVDGREAHVCLERSTAALIDFLTSVELRGILVSLAGFAVGRQWLFDNYARGLRRELLETMAQQALSPNCLSACESIVVGAALLGASDTSLRAALACQLGQSPSDRHLQSRCSTAA